MLMGIDVGTTHCKVGLFEENGTPIMTTSLATPLETDTHGNRYYAPEAVWQVVRQAIGVVTINRDLRQIQAVGVASMAETGLLLDRKSGNPRTPLIPWHSQQAIEYVKVLEQTADPVQRFALSGIRPNYKCAVTKLLWLKDHDPDALENAVWLSTADYIVQRLTGTFVTDYSLAGRTFAFEIVRKQWDVEWLAALGLPANIFPEARPAGAVFPSRSDVLAPGTPVCIAGHDHVCAALAVGAIEPGIVLDSMGTAETLVGAWEGHPLGQREYDSGLLFGCHVVPGQLYWMGSLSSSGGSMEWLREQLNHIPYDDVERAMLQVEKPTGILYFPYLVGSSTDPRAKAAFIGLEQTHSLGHFFKAAIEGTAYEIEVLRGMVREILGINIAELIAVGGGTRSKAWMQVKADVSNCEYQLFPIAEATLLGAAMIAGIGSGLYLDAETALAQTRPDQMKTVAPDGDTHAIYRRLFEDGYLKLTQPLRDYYAMLARF